MTHHLSGFVRERMRRLLVTLLIGTVVLFPAANGQRQLRGSDETDVKLLAASRGADEITAPQLKNYLSFIASDELEGRDTPSRGLDIAAKFLATNLTRLGLKPAGDDGTYFQKIALRRDVIDGRHSTVKLNDQSLTFGDDYIPTSATGEVTGQLVFAGNGWFVKSKNIDAYRGIDAKGKIAIIFAPPDSFPRGISRSDTTGKRGEDWMDAREYAKQQGVAGLVIVPDFQFFANWARNRQRVSERGSIVVDKFNPQVNQESQENIGILASPRLATLLFSGESQSATTIFESAYGSGQLVAPFALNAEKKLTISVGGKADSLSTQNVVAIFEGSDPVLKNEYVALGAHYDHVGIGAPQNGDSIYNGADDDGSGTTALLSIAEALSKSSQRPKRSVLFVWHAGEEKGLWGSRYFTENPTVPLGNIVAQLNIDMIGRSKPPGDNNERDRELSGPNEIYVIGSRMLSSALGSLIESVNKSYLNLSLNYRYDDPRDPNRFFYRSDHYNYARKGIPIAFFFDGEHQDYHRPGDSADKIDYQKMEKVTRTIYMTLWEIATRPERPLVDKRLQKE